MFFFNQPLRQTPPRPSSLTLFSVVGCAGVSRSESGTTCAATLHPRQVSHSHTPGRHVGPFFTAGAGYFEPCEALTIVISQLSVKAQSGPADGAAPANTVLEAFVNGADAQPAIVACVGARSVDGSGNPRQRSYVTASGKPMPSLDTIDKPKSQGHSQAAGICTTGRNHVVRKPLAFILARDAMHLNPWLTPATDLIAKRSHTSRRHAVRFP
ncbi:MAG: manganese catalase [Glaciihabitans sp.]|nr:manganese catalase [Glaciihabitans sp.]